MWIKFNGIAAAKPFFLKSCFFVESRLKCVKFDEKQKKTARKHKKRGYFEWKRRYFEQRALKSRESAPQKANLTRKFGKGVGLAFCQDRAGLIREIASFLNFVPET